MADGLDILAALQGAQGGAGSLSSLQNLQYRPVETGYGIAAQGVASALPSLVNPYGSNFGNFASVLGGALVSGLLGYQARKAADERNLAQSRALTELLGANVTAERKQALLQESPRLAPVMSQLALQQKLQERSAAQKQAAELAKARMQAEIDVEKQLAIDTQRPFGEAFKPRVGGETDYFTPKQEATLFERQKEFKKSKTYTDALNNETQIATLAKGLFDENPITGQNFVVAAVQLREPGFVVRPGEQLDVERAQGILKVSEQTIRKAMGGGPLGLSARAMIMKSAKDLLEGRTQKLDQELTKQANDARAAMGISKNDKTSINEIKSRLRGSVGLESYEDIINKNANIPDAKTPEGFDFASLVERLGREPDLETNLIPKLREQFPVQERVKQAPAVAAQQAPAEPKPLSEIVKKIEATRNAPLKAGEVEVRQRRLSELLAKQRKGNLTAEEEREALGVLKFFGVR